MPLVRAGVRIEHDNATVAGVGDKDFVGGVVDGDRRRTIQRVLTLWTVHLAGGADGQQQLSRLRVLQDRRVSRRSGWRTTPGGGARCRAAAARAGRRRWWRFKTGA